MREFFTNNPLVFMAAVCLLPIVVGEGCMALCNHIQRKREDKNKYKPMR